MNILVKNPKYCSECSHSYLIHHVLFRMESLLSMTEYSLEPNYYFLKPWALFELNHSWLNMIIIWKTTTLSHEFGEQYLDHKFLLTRWRKSVFQWIQDLNTLLVYYSNTYNVLVKFYTLKALNKKIDNIFAILYHLFSSLT